MITDEEIGKGLLTLKMIWFAMLASLAIYLFVGLQVATNLKVSMNEETFVVLKWALYGLAFITLIITRYIRNLILSSKGQPKPATQSYQHPVLQKYTIAMTIHGRCQKVSGFMVLFYFSWEKTPRICIY